MLWAFLEFSFARMYGQKWQWSSFSVWSVGILFCRQNIPCTVIGFYSKATPCLSFDFNDKGWLFYSRGGTACLMNHLCRMELGQKILSLAWDRTPVQKLSRKTTMENHSGISGISQNGTEVFQYYICCQNRLKMSTQSVQPSQFRWDSPDFDWESRILTQPQ